MKSSASWFCACCLLVGASAPSSAHATDLLGLGNPAALAADGAAYAYAKVFAASSYAPLQEAASEQWGSYSPIDGNNLDLVSARLGAGVLWHGLALGVLQRQEWLGQASRDTLDVYRAQQLGLPLPLGANYALHYAVQGFAANGLSAGTAFNLDGAAYRLRLGATASLLQGTRVKRQSASGSATVQPGQLLAVNGSAANADSQLDTVANGFNANMQNGSAAGSGYSVDLGLRWESAGGVQMEWTVADAFSEMAWSGVPEVTLGGSSVFNGQFPGGYKLRVNFQEALPVKHALRLSVPVGPVRLELADTVLASFHFPSLGISTVGGSGGGASGGAGTADWEMGLDYDFFFKTLGLRLGNRHGTFSLRSDSLNPGQARALMLGFELRV